MAKIKHNPYVAEMIGAHSKGGTVERRKHFHDYDGNVTKIGRLEAFIPHQRNYVAHPAVGKELENQQAFGNVSHLAQEFIDALKHHTTLPEPKQAFLDAIKARFYAQLKGKPDPIAPRDQDGNYTIYARIDNFIRAVLRKESPQF